MKLNVFLQKDKMTTDLYTAADVKKVKELLYKEQQGKCALTDLPIDIKDCHTDHAHDELQLVRGVLYKQSNMVLGKLEGLWLRYLAYWYPHTLSDFLRAAADYLERSEHRPDTRWRHPGWMRKVTIKFNKLPATKQNEVLKMMGSVVGKNPHERKKLFAKKVRDKTLGFHAIIAILDQV